MFFDEINMHSGWVAKRKYCTPALIRYCEVPLANDVHADQHVGVSPKFGLRNLEVHEANLIRQADVHQVKLCLYFTISCLHLRHADRRETALINNVLSND